MCGPNELAVWLMCALDRLTECFAFGRWKEGETGSDLHILTVLSLNDFASLQQGSYPGLQNVFDNLLILKSFWQANSHQATEMSYPIILA